MVKRIIDFTAALVLLLLLAPVFAVIAILISFDTSGGIFFLQRRVGRGGKTFPLVKFRTMLSYSEGEITAAGRVLRRFGLDELPILLNVLFGHMSFIGPRPQPLGIAGLFRSDQRRILTVRPGIFAPSRIAGSLERTAADLAYVSRAGLPEDIRLAFEGFHSWIKNTVFSGLSGRGKSYGTLLPADICCIAFSYFLANELRFEWNVPPQERTLFLQILPIVYAVRVPVFMFGSLYRTVWKYIGPKDLVRVAYCCTVSSVLIAAATFLTGFTVASRTVFVIDWICLMFLMAMVRVLPRLVKQSRREIQSGVKNVLIVGAGDLGEMVVRETLKGAEGDHRLIGFVDDNDAKQGSLIHGVPVLGKYADIPALAEHHRLDEVLIAVTNVSARGMKDILRHCESAKVRHRIVPCVTDLLSGRVYPSKIRNVTVADLLGHRPVELNLAEIRGLLQNKTVLITGAGGSIGSELCRQVAEYGPAKLIGLDCTENALAEVQNDLREQHHGTSIEFQLCNITDRNTLFRIFRENRPDLVFHAAAHKHVPICESHPDLAVINNVRGTMLVASAAAEYGCESFVMISTDKAVNPTSVMGCTKRIAELFVQSLSRVTETRFVTVRFGNVVHSNGSVVPIFLKQISKGGPVTITHPDVWRFFMSIPEAIQLILQSATMGKGGEVFVLDMGRPVRIIDLAQELIRRAGYQPGEDIDIVFTGLRPGEKLMEELLTSDEQALQTPHSRIRLIKTPPRDFHKIKQQLEEICSIAEEQDAIALLEKMREIVPEYHPWTADSVGVKALPPAPSVAALRGADSAFSKVAVTTAI
ncbi:MAG TPA: SDR family NAD(P)-dependent oxidoreductase [Terriglobia bacterium]|nr:SDR family NAD(P)-dependent oxidoreductase [Terriglobia bacterium]